MLKKFGFALAIMLLPLAAMAQSNYSNTAGIRAYNSSKDANKVTIVDGVITMPVGAATSAKQDTGNASLSSIDTKLTAPLSVTGPATDAQLRATPLPVSGTVAATQSGTWNVTNLSGTVSLPTGASTSALQTSGNASLTSIDSKLTSPLTVTGPLTDTQLRATAVPISGTVAVTGVATAANQTTANASLSSIDTKLTSPLTVSVPAVATGGYSFGNITDASTTTLKSGAGKLHSIVVNTRGVTSNVTVYDNTAGSGTKIATIDTTLTTAVFEYDLAFTTGLTVVTTGGTPADLTITYK